MFAAGAATMQNSARSMRMERFLALSENANAAKA
jgi:hypothetical protein